MNHGRREYDYVKKLEVPSCQHLLYQGASPVLVGTLVPIRGYVAWPNMTDTEAKQDFISTSDYCRSRPCGGCVTFADAVTVLSGFVMSWRQRDFKQTGFLFLFGWARRLARYLAFQGDAHASLNYNILSHFLSQSQRNSTNEQ